ncbi:MAG: UDP-glucuronic acid decarboxylase family protein [Oligoflexales bacterium]
MRINGSKRVLITGGAGFIGSHLCERFLNEGYEVICLDSFFTGSKKNIYQFLDNPKFEFIRHDLTQSFYGEAELILNFACPASPVHYQYDPIHTLKTSVNGTLNMLGMAKKTGATIVQASTSEVYGDPEQHPQEEHYWGNVNPIGIRSCYDEGKRAAESLCADYNRVHNVDARLIRIFNTYGPNMACNDGRVVSNFITQALKNQDITVYGNGSQTRSFCYVSDLVEGIFRIATSPRSKIDGPYNLGNDREFTVRELAELVIKKTNSQSRIVEEDLPSDDPKCRRPNLGKVKEIFDWNPKVNLENGLDQTIPYFSKVLDKNN